MLAHWYHVWCGGEWRIPLTEHLGALMAAECEGPLFWGAVGPDGEIEAAEELIGRPPVVRASEGFEQITLQAVHEYARTHDGAIGYGHTKGAHDNTDFRTQWRRSMTRHVVGNWRENLAALDEYDAVGCHWLTPEQFPPWTGQNPEFGDGLSFFAGNYWIARCDYLRRLPECPTESRFQAERWIGMGEPNVFDLAPGWPSEELFACE
jgi:hypothetical protein